MICVIADDLSGAAELAGVALRYGWTAEVQLEFELRTHADLVCISTDTRSGTASEAAVRTAHVAEMCRTTNLALIFKKVDSVLRGWVAVELAALMRGLGKPRALLVPANPSLGRIIRNGRYLIHGRPLHETDFALDPEHPMRSSDVLSFTSLQLTGLDQTLFPPIHLLPVGSELPPAGILVGEAASPDDVVAWAECLDELTLPAGAAEFFAALLAQRGFGLPSRTFPISQFIPPRRALFVSGSTSDASRSFLQLCEEHGVPVLRMPSGLFEGEADGTEPLADWVAVTVQALRDSRWAVVAIDRPLHREPGIAQRLGNCLATAVQRVLEQQTVEGIFVEGGATAAALVRTLGWKRLVVQGELRPGVVLMHALETTGPVLVTKPGSYAWPQEICRLLLSI